MITVLKPNTTDEQREHLIRWLESQNVQVHVSRGREYTILGLVGDTAHIDVELLESLEIVQSVKRVSEPFKKCNRKFHPEDTVVSAGGVPIGGGHFAVIAGPCSVESLEQITSLARAVQAGGAQLLRGGAFKPRVTPYDFQGLYTDALELLRQAKKATGLPLVLEIMDLRDLDILSDVDVIQVGARNMQNYELLKALGRTDKTVLLKRGIANTLDELLMSAEYILAGGNENVILCERGIRTFETYTHYTLDLSSIPVLRRLTHLPVVVDPSHAAGHADLVPSLAMAAVAAGADGVMLEVHGDPRRALTDGGLALTPAQFGALVPRLERIREVVRT